MARKRADDASRAIEHSLRQHLEGISARSILNAISPQMSPRTLQYRLQRLVEDGRIVREGVGKNVRYRLFEASLPQAQAKVDRSADVPLSPDGKTVQEYVRQPPQARKPVGYNREFLDGYRPNRTAYLSTNARAHLAELGRTPSADLAAGTYAKQILSRLLIDLAWNSSRLEGNTYSFLDTKRLIEQGKEAEGRGHFEAQMILNHKDAIEFLVGNVAQIGFNRYTICNLHASLANNLLPDPAAIGRLRHIPVGIQGSVFHPLETPQLIAECFDQILHTAMAISNPFEQSFFVTVHLPYLQPFDDVNKRVARLAANIPFFKGNLSPLSFADVPHDVYRDAILGVYELNQYDLMRDVFVWAYERSAGQYAALRQSIGEPDAIRLRYRSQLQELIADLVLRCLNRQDAHDEAGAWAERHIDAGDRDRFIAAVDTELVSLHEGNFARYRVTPSQFTAWQQAWCES